VGPNQRLTIGMPLTLSDPGSAPPTGEVDRELSGAPRKGGRPVAPGRARPRGPNSRPGRADQAVAVDQTGGGCRDGAECRPPRVRLAYFPGVASGGANCHRVERQALAGSAGSSGRDNGHQVIRYPKAARPGAPRIRKASGRRPSSG